MNMIEAREAVAKWSKKNGFRWEKSKAEALAKFLSMETKKAEKKALTAPKLRSRTDKELSMNKAATIPIKKKAPAVKGIKKTGSRSSK